MGINELLVMVLSIAVPSLVGLLWRFDNRVHALEWKVKVLSAKVENENTTIAQAISGLTLCIDRRSRERDPEFPKPLEGTPWTNSPPFDRLGK